MKKVKKTIEKDYKMPHIYKDDLEEIIKILEEANFKKYEISTGEYDYDNIEEVPKDLKSTNELYISAGTFLDFLLRFTKSFASLKIREGNDTIKSSGLFKRVDEVISNRERKILWFFCNISLYGTIHFAIILGLISFLQWINIITIGKYLNLIVIFIIWILIIFLIVSYRLKFNKYSKIEFSKICYKKIFFIRNKDTILKIIIPIITLVIGALISKYFLN